MLIGKNLEIFYFETDWDTIFAPEQDANTLWSNLTSVLNRGILSHVPLIRVTNRSRKNAHSKKTMNLIRKKKFFWKKSKAKPNKKSLRDKYKAVALQLKTAIAAESAMKESAILESGNLGLFLLARKRYKIAQEWYSAIKELAWKSNSV